VETRLNTFSVKCPTFCRNTPKKQQSNVKCIEYQRAQKAFLQTFTDLQTLLTEKLSTINRKWSPIGTHNL